MWRTCCRCHRRPSVLTSALCLLKYLRVPGWDGQTARFSLFCSSSGLSLCQRRGHRAEESRDLTPHALQKPHCNPRYLRASQGGGCASLRCGVTERGKLCGDTARRQGRPRRSRAGTSGARSPSEPARRHRAPAPPAHLRRAPGWRRLLSRQRWGQPRSHPLAGGGSCQGSSHRRADTPVTTCAAAAPRQPHAPRRLSRQRAGRAARRRRRRRPPRSPLPSPGHGLRPGQGAAAVHAGAGVGVGGEGRGVGGKAAAPPAGLSHCGAEALRPPHEACITRLLLRLLRAEGGRRAGQPRCAGPRQPPPPPPPPQRRGRGRAFPPPRAARPANERRPHAAAARGARAAQLP